MCKRRGRLEQQCCQTNTHERKSSCVWSGHVSLTQIQHKGKDTHGSGSRPGLFTHNKGKKRRSREAKENGDKFADAENDDKEEEEEEEIEEEEKTTQSNDRQ